MNVIEMAHTFEGKEESRIREQKVPAEVLRDEGGPRDYGSSREC